MRSAVRIALVVVLGALAALSSTPTAAASENESFGITPFPEQTNGSDRSSFSIPLETGATFEDAVRVYNLTDEPLLLALYAADAQTALDNTISVGLRDEHPESVGTWIDLPLKRIELEARDAKTVTFRVKVRSADPEPELGAIVVEDVNRNLAANAAKRLHVLVRTVPPNTQTSSKRVGTLLLRSPWVAIALLGLVVAGALVWIGARRARRVRDLVVQPGSFEDARTDGEGVPQPSRPAIARLGGSAADQQAKMSVFDRVRASAGARRRDERPLLDDPLLVEVDENEDVDDRGAGADDAEPASWARPPAQAEASERKPAPRKKTSTPRSRARKPKPRTASAKRAPAATTVSPAKRKAAKATAKRPSTAKKPKPKTKAASRKPKPAEDKNFIPLKDL